VKSVTVARNYAEALFAAGDEFGPLLDAVAGAVQADDRIATALESPRVSKAAKALILERALKGEAPPKFVRFLQAVVPAIGAHVRARTNRSLMSMCPHSSHFSQASAGISSFTRSDVRGLRSFLNQAIRATVGNLKATICEGPSPGASPDRVTRCQSSA